MAFSDDFSAALNNLQGSVNVPNSPPTSQVGTYNAPSYVAMNLPTWNLNQSDFTAPSSNVSSQLPSSSGGGSSSFINNLMSSLRNTGGAVLNGIGKGFDWFEHLPAINQIEGAWKGFGHGYAVGANNDNNGNGYAGKGLDFFALPTAFKEALQGFQNPDQARQNIERDWTTPINNSNVPGWAKFGTNVLAGTVDDPVSFAPIGGLVKGAGLVARGIGSLIGKGAKSADEAANAVRTAATNEPSIIDQIGNASQSMGADASVPSLADMLKYKNSLEATPANIPSSAEPPSLAQLLNDRLNPRTPATGKVVNSANNMLQNLFNKASEVPLPPGREYETLQDMWSSMAPKTAGNLDWLINASTQQPRSLGDIANELNAQKAYGVYPKVPANARNFSGVLKQNPFLRLSDAGIQGSEETPSLAEMLRNRNVADIFKGPGETAAGEYEMPSLASFLPKSNPIETADNTIFQNGPVSMNAGFNLKQIPVVRQVLNTVGKGFIKNYGASPELVNALRAAGGQRTADEFNIIQGLKSLAQQNKGLTSDQLNQIGHIIEGTQSGTTEQATLAQKLSELTDKGVSPTTGTQAMRNTLVNGNPILPDEMVRPNYFRHLYNNVPNALKNVFPKENVNGLGGLSSKGTFTLPRTFETLQDAENAGLKPELNPYTVVGKTLADTSRAVNNARLLEQIKNVPGLLYAKDPIDEVSKLVKTGRMDAEQAAAKLGITAEDLKFNPFVQSQIPQLNGHYIRQADENALRQFLQPKQVENPLGKAILSKFDKAQGIYKKINTYNTLVHGHNISWNGFVLGGAKFSNVKETMKNLMNGTTDEWLQRTMKAGAISSDREGFLNNLEKTISGVSQSSTRRNLAYMLHGALWDLDKALRTAIFRQAIEKGATDAGAAAKANKFMIDYNNLTPFEEQVLSRFFPFYRWMKGDYPLQFQQWLSAKGFPKQAAYEAVKSTINKLITGNWNNQQDRNNRIPVDSKIDTGIVLPDGSHVMIDPYSPTDEPIKLINEGILPTFFSKLSPLLKEGILQSTNQQYYPGPDFAPKDKESMANKPIRQDLPENVPDQLKGYNERSTVSHLANDLIPGSGVVGSLLSGLFGGSDSHGAINNAFGMPSKSKPAITAAELITKALGGFTSRDNPELDDYYQQKNGQSQLQNMMSLEKKYGLPVSGADKKQAYKKVPFPSSFGN